MLKKSIVFVCLLLGGIECGTNLCENGAKIDAITYVTGKNMWFFTSGGHYWFVKAEDFPPKGTGTPLPGGFKRGDAAIYKNTLEACAGVQSDKPKPQEQEIHLIEMVNGENKILIYDTRDNRWVNEDSPTPYNKDRGLGQAKIDWTKPIDAALIYKKTNIVVIQGTRYSVVDIMNVCKDPNGWGEGRQSRPTTEINVQSAVDATAAYDDRYFYLFQDQVFWKVEINTYKASEGKLSTTKNIQQDVVTEFFKFQEHCQLPPTDASAETSAKSQEGGPVGEADTQPPEESEAPPQSQEPQEQPEEETPEPGGGESLQSTAETEDEGGFPWIIVVIIVIIVILIAIVLIACLAMRKGKGKDAEAQDMAPGASGTGSATGGSRAKSSMGNSPSTMTQRSGTGGAKGGSAVGSKVGGKGGVKPMSSSMGTSPSTMSVRSNAGLATSKAGSKTGSKK